MDDTVVVSVTRFCQRMTKLWLILKRIWQKITKFINLLYYYGGEWPHKAQPSFGTFCSFTSKTKKTALKFTTLESWLQTSSFPANRMLAQQINDQRTVIKLVTLNGPFLKMKQVNLSGLNIFRFFLIFIAFYKKSILQDSNPTHFFSSPFSIC